MLDGHEFDEGERRGEIEIEVEMDKDLILEFEDVLGIYLLSEVEIGEELCFWWTDLLIFSCNVERNSCFEG